MTRRFFAIASLGAMLFALCGSTQAQQPGKVPQVGILFAATPAAITSRLRAFKQGLQENGYVENKNIVIHSRYGEGKLERMPQLAAELVTQKVDVIVTGGPTDTRAAKQATTTIPIVMAQDSDPVGSGFVSTLARPGGNITGLSTLSPELSGKQLDLLKEIVSKISRVAVIGNSIEPGNSQTVREMELAGGGLGVQLRYLDARSRMILRPHSGPSKKSVPTPLSY